jgi:uncharacterized protein YjaZ
LLSLHAFSCQVKNNLPLREGLLIKKIAFISIFLICQFVQAHSTSPEYRSLSDGFRRFIADATNLSLDEQINVWIKDVESLAPEVYLHIIAGDDQTKLASERRILAQKWFPLLFANAAEIQKQFDLFETQGKPIINELAASYPEANLSTVTVMDIPSLNKFNGQVTSIHGHIYVMFGMDMIALINQKPDLKAGALLVNNMPVLMSHEFTHAIHYILSDFGSGDPSTASFWGPLWDEGLAQVNSQLLNPGLDLTNIFMEKVLTTKCTPENIQAWAKSYIEDSKGNEQQVETAYWTWFTLSSGLTEHGTYRAGYCLGYNVILTALRTYSMKEIIKMSRADAYRIGQETLVKFAFPKGVQ